MNVQIIKSSSNERLKVFKTLITSKGIKEHHQFLLSGVKLIEEFLHSKTVNELQSKPARFNPKCFIFNSEDQGLWPPFLQNNTNIEVIIISKDIFNELDVVGTKQPLLVLEFKDFEKKDFEKNPVGLELISPLGDPRNLGSLIRSAVGLNVCEIILTQESTHPYLPQAVKASAGAALYADFKKSDLAVAEIPTVGNNFALALEGKTITSITWPKDLRLWVGEEGPGLKITKHQKNNLQLVQIPTVRIESLNAMVAATVAMWEWKKSLQMPN